MEEKIQLSELAPKLTEYLRAKRYKEGYLRTFLATWKQLEQYMSKSGIASYGRKVGESYLKERFGDVAYRDLKKTSKNIVRRIEILSDYQEKGSIQKHHSGGTTITFQGELGSSFNAFIRHARELKRSEGTIQNYKRCLNLLYLDLQQSGKTLADINIGYLVQFLLHLQKRPKNGDHRLIMVELRMFFKYLCSQKALSDNREEYWMSILKAKSVQQPKIPSVYSIEEIERLIGAVDRGSPSGKRNYAMILLGARYGLRISDIIGLRFCNIDWKNNRIALVQGKTQRHVEFPLSEEVGNAIIDYLKFSRPKINEPYVFLTVTAPHHQLSKTGLNRIITECMEKADISFEERKKGSHILRHSLATNLLAEKEPLPVISEILGHSSTESTKCYLRVDFIQLKQCALEVSCVPSSFYKNLYAS